MIVEQIYSIEKVILMGQSMGGNLVQDIAYYCPELALKCILIDCTINTQPLTVIEKIVLKMSRIILNIYPEKTLVRHSAKACGKTAYTQDYVRACFEKIEKANFIEIMMSLYGCLREDTAFTFKQPLLLICGKDDRAGNIKKSMKVLAKKDIRCALHIIENAGHNAHQDNPDDVNNHIKIFLEKN